MPRGDGTGPAGQGPMTGRGLGYCAGYPVPGFTNPGFSVFGYGLGMAWRRGRGFGRGFRFRTMLPKQIISITPQQVIPVQQPYPTIQPIPAQLTTQDEKALLEQEKKTIKQEMEILKQELEDIEKRMKELK